jgi:hypothetical protein
MQISPTYQAARRALAAMDLTTARQLLQDHLATYPDDVNGHLDLAACCLTLKSPAAALRHASIPNPGSDAARAGLIKAKALRALQRMDSAEQQYKATLAIARLPVELEFEASTDLADLLLNTFGDPEAAAATLARRRHPKLSERASESKLLAALYTGAQDALSLSRAFVRHARKYIDLSSPNGRQRKQRSHQRRKVGKPRIGITSPSLGATPVGFLTLGALQILGEQAELIYFDRSAGFRDWLAQGFRHSAREWVSCQGVAPTELAAQIRSQDLDAVIDCGGWTDIDALRALSLRPVAKQFKWVGGQALTTGLDCFTGYLADQWQVPLKSGHLYREPILRFDGPYVTYVPPPYFDFRRAAKAKTGVYALVSNPAKISSATLSYLKRLKPKRLIMIDHRWRYQHTRNRFLKSLQAISPAVDFVVPNGHKEYLDTLHATSATFVDTQPYSMGLTAVELLLMGKAIVGPRPRAVALMCERHSSGHQRTKDFAGYAAQAEQLLRWCRD